MKNPYLPIPMVVKKAHIETTDRMLRTLELSFVNEEDAKAFHFTPGQFCELSILGKGEAPFGIASSPTEKGSLKFTINKAGVVTTALHQIEEGDGDWDSRPFGQWIPDRSLPRKEYVGDWWRICLYHLTIPDRFFPPSGQSE